MQWGKLCPLTFRAREHHLPFVPESGVETSRRREEENYSALQADSPLCSGWVMRGRLYPACRYRSPPPKPTEKEAIICIPVPHGSSRAPSQPGHNSKTNKVLTP